MRYSYALWINSNFLLAKADDWSYIWLMSKRELKKEQLLELGMDVMKARGFNGTSVKDIVDAAGVPKGSFYTYFDSKETFAVEALEKAAQEGLQLMRNKLNHTGEAPLVRLRQFFESKVDEATEAGFTIGCFLGNICQEMADSSDVIRLKVRQTLRNHTQLIQDVLEEAQQQGDIAPNCDTREMAEFIFNAWEGALMRMKAAKCREPLDAFLAMLPRVVAAAG